MAQAEDSFYSSSITNCVFNAFSSYTAIMLNSLTIHAMRKTSTLPNPLKTLLLSLAVSDLGVGLIVQPYYILFMAKQLQSYDHQDSGYYFVAGFLSFATFLGVLSLSMDRFLSVHLHLRYQELVTHKRVVAVVIVTWVFSAFLSLISLWYHVVLIAIAAAIIFGLCIVCTTVVYCRIYFIVRRHRNQMRALVLQQLAQNGEMENAARLRKSAISAFYVYLVFLVCYLPEYCRFVAHICGTPIILQGFQLYTFTLMFLNSSLNPVIYCWRMRHIRRAIMDILRNIYQKLLNKATSAGWVS